MRKALFIKFHLNFLSWKLTLFYYLFLLISLTLFYTFYFIKTTVIEAIKYIFLIYEFVCLFLLNKIFEVAFNPYIPVTLNIK